MELVQWDLVEQGDKMVRFQRRQRTSFNSQQLDALTAAFNESQYPQADFRDQLAKRTNLDPTRIQVWFQNQRAKYKKRSGQSLKSPSDVWPLREEDDYQQTIPSSITNRSYGTRLRHSVSSGSNEPAFSQSEFELAVDSSYDRVERNIRLFSENGVHLFSSELANEAARAVHEGKCESMVQYHRKQLCRHPIGTGTMQPRKQLRLETGGYQQYDNDNNCSPIPSASMFDTKKANRPGIY